MKAARTGLVTKEGSVEGKNGLCEAGLWFVTDSRTPQQPDPAPPTPKRRETTEKSAAGTFWSVVQRDPGQLFQTKQIGVRRCRSSFRCSQ